MDLALLILRVVVGALFVGHGAQKLFGVWGGHGLAGTAGFFEAIGLRPGRIHAPAAGAAELVGGALVLLGLFTPIGSALIIAVMVAAALTVHLTNGLWATENGIELNLVYAAAAVALAGIGAGIDLARRRVQPRPRRHRLGARRARPGHRRRRRRRAQRPHGGRQARCDGGRGAAGAR